MLVFVYVFVGGWKGVMFVYLSMKLFVHTYVHCTQNELANRFELTGGFIRNAILSALSVAVSRDGENPVITHADFVQGANFQLRGRLRMKVRMEMLHI